MPRKSSSNGMILIVCPGCGFVFSMYNLGLKNNNEKYMGAPMLARAVSQYDIKIEPDGSFRCPMCNARLSLYPKTVSVMSYKKFVKKFFLDVEERKLIPRREPSIEHIPSAVGAPTDITVDTHGPGQDSLEVTS